MTVLHVQDKIKTGHDMGAPQSVYVCLWGFLYVGFFLFGLVCLSGCSLPWDDKSLLSAQPTVDFVIPLSFSTKGFVDTTPQSWLVAISDKRLDALVEEGLKQNYDLRVAAHRVQAATHLVDISTSLRKPNVASSFGAQHHRTVPSLSTNRFSALLEVDWEYDLWGSLQDIEDTALAELQVSASLFRASRLSLAINIAKNWYFVVLHRQQEILAKSTWENYQANLQVVESSYRRGINDILDVWLARSNVAEAKETLALVKRDFLLRQRTLNTLLGRAPGSQISLQEMVFPKISVEVPVGIPSDLLKRRPDIKEASARYMGAVKNVSVAHKDLYPSIRLTANGGINSTQVRDFFDLEENVWSVLGSVAAPIFLGGRLRAQLKARREEWQAALNQYRSVVLSAFHEAQTAMFLTETLEHQLNAALTSLEASKNAQTIAYQYYIEGIVDYVTVLEAQRRFFSAQRRVLNVQNEIVQNRLDLYLYLGGDF